MDIIKAIILGIVQGLTEFLPVSSSGHLEIAEYLLNSETIGQQSVTMSVVLHFATALSTMIVLRRDIVDMVVDLSPGQRSGNYKLIGYIILSMIPAALVGYFFEDMLDSLFDQKLWLVGICLWVTAILLWVADRDWDNRRDITASSAVTMGIAQMCALLPGISRSGATIAAALICGVKRSAAAKFSFLMVLPLIFGKIAKDMVSGDLRGSDMDLSMGLGFLAALITGVIACRLMIRWVENSKLRYFGIYCLIVGAVALVLWINQ